MRAEVLIDLMHSGLLTIQCDIAKLADAAIDHALTQPLGRYLFQDAMPLANHAVGLRDKINAIVAATEPLAAEHITAAAKFDQEHDCQGIH